MMSWNLPNHHRHTDFSVLNDLWEHPYGLWEHSYGQIMETIQGPARICLAEDVIGELIDCHDDIIELREGAEQYDIRPWITELGVARTRISFNRAGIEMTIMERHPKEIYDAYQSVGPNPALIIMTKKPDTEIIRTYMWYKVQLHPMEVSVPWRGEAMATPVRFGLLSNGIVMESG
jgi:hypothetical protein